MNDRQCSPIKSLKGIENWMDQLELYEDVIDLPENGIESTKHARTLVCHDMAGGYLNDRFVDGCDVANDYRFYHWSHIDIFVYFSHHFVTVPPVGWINAAHRHNVPVLGTFITEWEDGKEICAKFLSNKDAYERLANQLADIAYKFKFDGWLVNIENKIEPEKMEDLVCFVKILWIEMHKRNNNSYIIWYDSVIDNGQLKWQNELNSLNKCFFDVCDGIFINYTWKENNLIQCIKAAEQRINDVYIGVDVFGRNCFGGGGFCTNLAMSEVRKKNLSCALFATGWVHEVCGAENFETNQAKFWSLINPYCNIRPITSLPIKTSFCQGFGQKMYQKGEVISNQPWFNLSAQNLQSSYDAEFNDTCKIHTETAFNGGSCYQLQGELDLTQQAKYFCIFKSRVEPRKKLEITWVFKDLLPNNVSVVLRTNTVQLKLGSKNEIKQTSMKVKNGWNIWCFVIEQDFLKGIIEEIGFEINLNDTQSYNILLGHLEIHEDEV